jgi:hypothetical protein
MVGFRSYSLPEWILIWQVDNRSTLLQLQIGMFSLLIPSDITAQY